MKKKAKVFVGVSGGVDSSVSLALLRDKGYDVTGVFIKTWQPDFIECTMINERRDAIRVCAHLGVPFLECDAEEAYKKEVVDYMVSEYKYGRTPNPDILCNREIKFKVFWDFAKSHGADFIATGHYAKIVEDRSQNVDQNKNASHFTLQASGSEKDQTYFLWKLTQEDLAHILFPIGNLTKGKVRKLAEKYNLPTAFKKDSQGVCMLGDLDMKDFLGHYISDEVGDVLSEDGKKIGKHRGVRFYTVGERHGFSIFKNNSNQKPYFITKRNVKENTLVVSENPEIFKGKIVEIRFSDVNAISEPFKKDQNFDVRFRHRGTLYRGVIKDVVLDEIIVSFSSLDKGIDVGQSGVFYSNLQTSDVCKQGRECLGGGVISGINLL